MRVYKMHKASLTEVEKAVILLNILHWKRFR